LQVAQLCCNESTAGFKPRLTTSISGQIPDPLKLSHSQSCHQYQHNCPVGTLTKLIAYLDQLQLPSKPLILTVRTHYCTVLEGHVLDVLLADQVKGHVTDVHSRDRCLQSMPAANIQTQSATWQQQ
jgi:hypothetical protein